VNSVLPSRVKPLHRRLVGGAVLLAAAFFAAGLPFVDGQGGYAGLSPRFLPTLVTLGLGICGVLLLLRSDAIEATSEESTTAILQPERFRRLALLMGGLLAHLILINWIGFVLASAFLMAIVARAYSSEKWLRDAVIGLSVALPIWLLFTQLLGLNLPLLPLLSPLLANLKL
jgi:putative tricarboxylic transport membrane protein